MSQIASRKIEYLAPQRQHDELADELLSSIKGVLLSDEAVTRKTVQQFEEMLSHYCGVAHAIAVNSGTDALTIALSILDVPPRSQVITSDFGFFSTVAAIINAGLTPVVVDIDPRTFNLDPSKVESSISDTTKVILPVHLFGMTADLGTLSCIARKYSLILVEDAAQALGARLNGSSVGSVGAIGALSFNWSKNLATQGNGGAIITNDVALAKKCEIMRNYGMSGSFYHTELGMNSRLDPLEAAILLVKLKHLDRNNERRILIAQLYNKYLESIPEVRTPSIGNNLTHVFHKYAILAENRDELRDYLQVRGVETMVFYPTPLHKQPCFADHIRVGNESLAVTENATKNILCLPIYPELTDSEVKYVAECISTFYSNPS